MLRETPLEEFLVDTRSATIRKKHATKKQNNALPQVFQPQVQNIAMFSSWKKGTGSPGCDVAGSGCLTRSSLPALALSCVLSPTLAPTQSQGMTPVSLWQGDPGVSLWQGGPGVWNRVRCGKSRSKDVPLYQDLPTDVLRHNAAKHGRTVPLLSLAWLQDKLPLTRSDFTTDIDVHLTANGLSDF